LINVASGNSDSPRSVFTRAIEGFCGLKHFFDPIQSEPVSNADDIFWRRFGMILAVLTLFGFVVAFIARSIAGDAHQATMNSPTAVAERIAPEGSERVGDPTQVVAPTPKASAMASAAPAAMAAASGPVSAEQTYNANCMACHASGVAGAPKKGDAAAWAPRIAQGEDALVQSVVKGKGAMPPKAGNPSLTEEQIRASVRYLIGTDSGAASTAKEAAAAATSLVKDAAAAASGSAEKMVEKAKTMAESAGRKIGAAASSATSAVTAAASSSMPAAANDGKPGNEVYNMGCVACHATGAANAPKLTDKAAWEPRAATGIAALQQSVINGKGAMPPRAGLTSLSDADINNAIRYMLKEAGVEAGS
jgi:cytochrome c5